jgi:hypothetical protein
MQTTIRRTLALVLAICMGVLLFPVTTSATTDNNFKKAIAISLDGAASPVRDPKIANGLPITGYLEKSFVVDSKTRTAKIYIAAHAPIRSYFTVIAVPDGFTTEEFLRKSGWKDIADETQEGLFVLEPGQGGWGSVSDELNYVSAAMNFYMGTGNPYFSIFGEHYLVGYGSGAPALEAWAAANPLKVIGQVYIDSKGLPASYFDQFYTKEFDGTTAPGYTTVVFPAGFELIKYAETVLPTWYINPDKSASSSIAYWKIANDCDESPGKDNVLGRICAQAKDSDRWMTSYSGPISKVAVLDRPVSYWNTKTTGDIRDFLTYYTRYENFFAYGNQLVVRADYEKLGIEIHTMDVNGFAREYMVYVPDSAKTLWGNKAPVMWVWAGNSQTDKVFLDATQWWKIAQEKGIILVFPCEKINTNAISVSHGDSTLYYQQLRDEIIRDYAVDATRFYFTGQSAGSMLSQSFAIALPEFFAAVASTSGPASLSASGTIRIDGVTYPASNKMIPNYMIYGYGDLGDLKGTLWDSITNGLDNWAAYFLGTNGFVLTSADEGKGVISGWYDRFTTWTWAKQFGSVTVPLFKVTKDVYRSHNCIYEEMPMLWDFAEHFSYEGGVRYYSESGFKVVGDKVKISP